MKMQSQLTLSFHVLTASPSPSVKICGVFTAEDQYLWDVDAREKILFMCLKTI